MPEPDAQPLTASHAQSGPRTGEKRGALLRHRRLLLVLSITVLVIGLGLLSYPFIPRIQYALFRPAPLVPYETKLLEPGSGFAEELGALPETPRKPIPEENRIVIPKIGVDVEIVEGKDQRVLSRGIWHIPDTSNPAAGGNTVLSGHRFQYLPPSSKTLYLLDKLENGDLIIVYWEGVEYDYRVNGQAVVNPTQTEILENTPDNRLTLFTCTPLFSTSKRLVIFSEQVS